MNVFIFKIHLSLVHCRLYFDWGSEAGASATFFPKKILPPPPPLKFNHISTCEIISNNILEIKYILRSIYDVEFFSRSLVMFSLNNKTLLKLVLEGCSSDPRALLECLMDKFGFNALLNCFSPNRLRIKPIFFNIRNGIMNTVILSNVLCTIRTYSSIQNSKNI